MIIILKSSPATKTAQRTYYNVLAADYAVVANLLDKSRPYQIAETMGINTPLTNYLTSPSALAEEKKELSFPCLIKPTEGHRFFEIYGRKLFIIKDAKSWKSVLPMPLLKASG